MTLQQQYIVMFYAAVSVLVFLVGLYQSFVKKNSYGLVPWLIPLGMFVWGDAIIICLFWIIISAVAIVLQDWLLFLLIVSVFWVVRNIGEAIFWFNQQFSQKIIYPPEILPGYSLVKNESIWFIYQIINQCFAVVFIVVSLYIGRLWLLQM